IILRVDKRGIPMPLSSDEHGPLSGISMLMAASGFTDKVMKLGEEINVDVEAKDGKPKVKGTIKLESLKDGVAKIVSQCDVTSEEFDNATLKMTATSLVDTATSKPNKIDLKCDFGASGFAIKTITLSMERIK
ncbi:MAG: hypothetical protein H0W86_09030, partial [Armatimonadetes bacterium]|nr:hypothetical protein [Armatimonadota bacterium]